MDILIFVVILVALIIGHEFGHLLAAKASGMKVPEFGLGFPPKLWGKKIGNTEYTINALPLGGFVKIVGEDDADATDPAAFARRPRVLQAATLLAGPLSNIFLGLVLSTLAFMVGIPAIIDSSTNTAHITRPHVLAADVLPKSPAAETGIKAGDEIVSISAKGVSTSIQKPQDVLDAITNAEGTVTLAVRRSGTDMNFVVTPKTGIDSAHPDHAVIGIAPALVGTLSLPIGEAFLAGITDTYQKTKEVAVGVGSLIGHAVTFSADFSQVSGPVGIVSVVGDAAGFGLGSILSLAALISINLGIINLLPFPALDGGRLAFLAVETISRKRIPAKIASTLNMFGFVALIVLMLAVTAHDLFRLFH